MRKNPIYLLLLLPILVLALVFLYDKAIVPNKAVGQEKIEFIATESDSAIWIDSSDNVHINYPGIKVYIYWPGVTVVWDTLK